jgi:hypothetical protein
MTFSQRCLNPSKTGKNQFIKICSEEGPDLATITPEKAKTKSKKPNTIHCHEVYDKENGHWFTFDAVEHQIEKQRIHDLSAEYTMGVTARDYIMFMNHMDDATRARTDSQIESFKLIKYFTHENIYYAFIRVLVRKIWIIKGKELLIVKAVKRLPTGEILEVMKSFYHENFPNDPARATMEIIKGGMLYETKDSENNGVVTHCKSKMLMNPKVGIPIKLIKPFFVSYYRNNYKTLFGELGQYVREGKNVWPEDVKVF